jgi:flagellar biosynthesis/type III secretory pathway chaperone
MRDRASEALTESLLPGEPRTYEAITKYKNVLLSTLHYRVQGRRSREEKAKS